MGRARALARHWEIGCPMAQDPRVALAVCEHATVAQAETLARLLYIVARDQPELFAFLRRDFAAEEAEGVIEILTDRRQGVQPCETEGRDPRSNWSVSVGMRAIGFTLVRKQACTLSEFRQ